MERIEGLVDEHIEIRAAFRHSYGGKQLDQEQRAFRTRLARGEVSEGGGMPDEIMLTFPGMPNYKGPVS